MSSVRSRMSFSRMGTIRMPILIVIFIVCCTSLWKLSAKEMFVLKRVFRISSPSLVTGVSLLKLIVATVSIVVVTRCLLMILLATNHVGSTWRTVFSWEPLGSSNGSCPLGWNGPLLRFSISFGTNRWFLYDVYNISNRTKWALTDKVLRSTFFSAPTTRRSRDSRILCGRDWPGGISVQRCRDTIGIRRLRAKCPQHKGSLPSGSG